MAFNTIDTTQAIRFLSRTFRQVTDRNTGLGNKNTSGTKLYDYQIKFSHIVDDIQRGPKYMVPKKISEANELIKEIDSLRR